MTASAATAPLLATSALCRRFGALEAVRDVALDLRRGQLHAVIGPNGAGKSTLVNLLSGELPPSSGSIRLDGSDVAGLPVWRRARLGIGRSYQRTNIFASLSVLENTRLGAQARLGGGQLTAPVAAAEDLRASARQALARVGLSAQESRIAGLLSHGEQRQLEIAMALATSPRVLLLDEPLAGMGPEESRRMSTLLKSLAREHAVLLIEHDMDVVFEVADWMTVMVDGAVLAAGPPAAIRANAAVQNAYLGGEAP